MFNHGIFLINFVVFGKKIIKEKKSIFHEKNQGGTSLHYGKYFAKYVT